MHDLNDVVAPQTVDSMTAALAESKTERRREILRSALAAGPGTAAWEDAESELASIE